MAGKIILEMDGAIKLPTHGHCIGMAVAAYATVLSFLTVVSGLLDNAVHNADNSRKMLAKKFVGGMEFKHRLRVCNAYPYDDALDVFRGGEKLTKLPLDYKMCGDFASPLLAGDKLKFKVGDANAGTFTVSDLPNNDAVLLLVIHRHDTLSTAVSFQSHVFANLLNAQVAVIDTYKGRAIGFPEISDGGKTTEKLRYNSVVAVNPGEYRVTLIEGSKKEVTDLVALNRESYVVIRAGVESQQGAKYPQELIVYPMSDPALLHSAASRMCIGAMMVFLSLALLYV
jgi:hypothetical protein